MAVVVPVVVGRLAVTEKKRLTGRPVPLVLGDVVLGVRKDASKPLEAFCLKVAEFRIGLAENHKLSKVHEQSVGLAATTVSLEKHLKERAGKKVRLGTRQGLPDDARFTAHSSLPWRPRPGPS